MQILNLAKFTVAALLLLSCQENKADDKYVINVKGQPVLLSLKRGCINYLECRFNDTLRSSWPLRYPVFRFLKGDVNNDGQDDIAVGVIKKTRRDTVMRKRLFLFQVRNKDIIPLWLGSSLGRPLEDFLIYKHDSITIIRSIEKEKDNRYLVAEYEWFGFGLSFREYLKREISLPEAQGILNK